MVIHFYYYIQGIRTNILYIQVSITAFGRVERKIVKRREDLRRGETFHLSGRH